MPPDTKRAGGEDQADTPVEKRQKIDPIESEHVEVKVKGKSKGSFLCASKKAWTEAEERLLMSTVETELANKNKAAPHNDKRAKHKNVDWARVATVLTGRSGAESKIYFEQKTGIRTVPATWTAEEDKEMFVLVKNFGARRWSEFAAHLPGRSGKQCRERWRNHLDPDIVKARAWTEEEERTVVRLYMKHGSKWALISRHIPGRTDNNIKNKWNASMAVRIERYLTKVLRLKPHEVRDPTDTFYMIPPDKIDECVAYMRSFTPAELKGAKRLKVPKCERERLKSWDNSAEQEPRGPDPSTSLSTEAFKNVHQDDSGTYTPSSEDDSRSNVCNVVSFSPESPMAYSYLIHPPKRAIDSPSSSQPHQETMGETVAIWRGGPSVVVNPSAFQDPFLYPEDEYPESEQSFTCSSERQVAADDGGDPYFLYL